MRSEFLLCLLVALLVEKVRLLEHEGIVAHTSR